MKDFITIFRRELGAYFNSAIAYIFLIVFSMVTCGVYMLSFFLVSRVEMRSFFGILPFMLIVFVPAITMRLWAEDRKSGTYELLLTFPMKTYQLVLGKFLASFAFYLVGLAMTLVIPIMLAKLGDPDFGPIWGGYFGSILCGAFFISIGLFISGLCKDQIVAFVLTMVVCFAFYMLGMPFVAMQVDGWTGSLDLGTRVLSFIAMTKHFESVERGLIDLRDVVYFIVMTMLFLGLNSLYLDSRMRPRAKSRYLTNVVVYALLVIFVNVVVNGFTGARFDLTEEKIYTVSKDARDVLSELKVPVKVDFYISPADKMPSLMKTFEQEVVDKLGEFELASSGNLKFQVHHVDAIDALAIQRKEMRENVAKQLGEEAANSIVGEKSDDEETEGEKLAAELMEKGIQPFSVQSIEADERTTVSIYSSISIAYKDKKEEVIPQITPNNFTDLEYELISKVFRLTREKQPRVAVIAPKDELEPQIKQMLMARGMEVPEAKDNHKIIGQLLIHEDYFTERFDFSKKQSLPDEADTVLVVNPRNWGERQRWEINRALNSGKSVIMAVQSYTQDYNSGAEGLAVTSQEVESGVNELLKQYGMEVNKEFLMDTQCETLNVQAGQSFGPFQMSTPVKLPTHIRLSRENANDEVSISNRLSLLFYLWGTTLDVNENKLKENNLKTTVLLKSGEESWTVPFKAGKLVRSDIEEPSEFEGGKPLAVLIEGQFPDVYEGQERPEWPESQANPNQPQMPEPEDKPAMKLEAKPGRLLLVGCGTMWRDDFIQVGSDMDFLINSVDALTMGDELIHIRTKTKIDRLIDKVTAGQKLWYRFFVMGFAPLLIAVFGIIRLWLRRRTKEIYLREVKRA